MRRLQHFTPDLYAATSQLAGQKRKRQRMTLSCLSCRERKIGCDRNKPCSNCSKQGTVDDCTYDRPLDGNAIESQSTTQVEPSNILQNSQEPLATDREAFDTANRISKLERVVEALSSKVGDCNATSSSVDSAHDASPKPIQSVAIVEPEDSKTPSNPHLEGIWAIKKSDIIHYIGRTGWTTANKDVSIFFADRSPFSNQWLAFWESASTFTSQDNAESMLMRMIPDSETCDVLIERFMKTWNTVHPIVDCCTFESELKEFWENRESKSTAWRVFFLAILSIGYQLPTLSLPRGKTVENGRAQGKTVMHLVENIMFAPRVCSRRPELASFQTLLLIMFSKSLDLDWVDSNDDKSRLLGLANRMVFTLGLHRNCSKVRGIPANVVKMRHMLWRTYTFIDMEHAVQCGMPFLLRDFESGTENITLDADTTTDLDLILSYALPTWAQIVHQSHSERVPTKDSVSDIQQQTAKIKFPPPISNTYDAIYLSSQTVRRTLMNCFHHRMKMALYSPLMHNLIPSQQSHAQAIVAASARAIIDNQALLARLIDTEPEPVHQSAWAHFVFSQTHCTFYYATSTVLGLLRAPTADLAIADTTALFNTLRLAQTIAARVLSISPDNFKEYMIVEALRCGAEERLRLPATERNRPEEAASVITAMQQAMDRTLGKIRGAIDEAVRSDDPPPGLCDDRSADEDANVSAAQGDSAEDAGNVGLEDWGALGADFFLEDVVDLNVPWWNPLPAWNNDGGGMNLSG